MQLINADEAIINFGFEYEDIPPTQEEFVGFLKRQKTIDAVPVVHGEWKLLHIGHGHLWECSVCNKTELRASDYCPNCGAKMDGGYNEN